MYSYRVYRARTSHPTFGCVVYLDGAKVSVICGFNSLQEADRHGDGMVAQLGGELVCCTA